MRYVVGFFAMISILAVLTDTQAAEMPPMSGCKEHCIAVLQKIDGKLANSFAMTCKPDEQRCYREGLVALFDETVPVAASGIFTNGGINIAFYTKAGNLKG